MDFATAHVLSESLVEGLAILFAWQVFEMVSCILRVISARELFRCVVTGDLATEARDGDGWVIVLFEDLGRELRGWVLVELLDLLIWKATLIGGTQIVLHYHFLQLIRFLSLWKCSLKRWAAHLHRRVHLTFWADIRWYSFKAELMLCVLVFNTAADGGTGENEVARDVLLVGELVSGVGYG